MAITETSSSLTSGEKDTGSSTALTEEAAHLPDPTTTDDLTTSTGIYCLQITTVFGYYFHSPVPKSEATSDMSPVISPHPSSTHTSGEMI